MVLIQKADGEMEPFDSAKLDHSLSRVNTSPELRNRIIAEVEATLREGMTTQEIYEHAFDLLKQERTHPSAARYSIKRAVLALGPSGFPFEQFVAEVFRLIGYTHVSTGAVLQGKCVGHEVDIVAEHNGIKIGAELKFHNNLGMKTDVKDALYVRARFNDLHNEPNNIHEAWLITNTRFTRNAIRYGMCSGLKLLGWDYPRGKGLEVLIDEAHVHPITALTTISDRTKRLLLDDNIVLCRQMTRIIDSLSGYGVDEKDIPEIEQELAGLCG